MSRLSPAGNSRAVAAPGTASVSERPGNGTERRGRRLRQAATRPTADTPAASAMTAGFGAIAEPLANARGSVQSHDREGVVAGNGTGPRGQRPRRASLAGPIDNRPQVDNLPHIKPWRSAEKMTGSSAVALSAFICVHRRLEVSSCG